MTTLDELRNLYQVYLLDGSRNIVAQVKSWLPPMTVALNYNDISSYVFTAPVEALSKLVPNGGVLITRKDQTLIHGPVVTPILQQDVANPNGLVTLSGRSDEIMLADRVCYPDPTLAFSAQTSGAQDTQTGVAETIIKHYVDKNAGPGAIAARQTAGLTVQATAGLGTSLTRNAQFDQLLTFIQEIAQTDQLGFRVALNGLGRQFQVFAPRDLSATVRFGLALGNLTSLVNQQDAPTATRELFGGGTAAGTKAFSETADTGSEATFGRRIEKYQSDAATTSTTVLGTEGVAALKTDGPQQTLTFAALDTATAQWGRDYVLGDKITVITDSGEVADVVRTATFDVQDGSAENFSITIGAPGATTRPQSYKAIRTLEAFIRNFSARR